MKSNLYVQFFVFCTVTMSKSFPIVFVLSLVPLSIPMLGCGGGDEAKVVEEERPGQFREMALEAAGDDDDQEER